MIIEARTSPPVQPGSQGDDPLSHFRHIRQLTMLGDYHGALAYAEWLTPPEGSFLAYYKAMFSGHAKLALGVDHVRLVADCLARENSSAWLTTDRLCDLLRGAIRDRTPLSLIRLGDGEARFLAFCAPWVRDIISREEAECGVGFHWENWFGQTFAAVAPSDLQSLAGAFQAALIGADILGVSPAARYRNDTFTRGYLGVLERVVGDITTRHQDVALASAYANVELHQRSAFYQELLSGIDFLGVISPHPGLAARLAHYHGISEVREYVVPGESRLPGFARGREAGLHIPDRYNELIATLRIPRQGAVFLVAAGLLAKIYCHRIRQLGGIAIDVGSIVDAWTGFVTRPIQHSGPGQWVLPGSASATDQCRKTVQRRFWSNGHHVWLGLDDVETIRSGGLIGPL